MLQIASLNKTYGKQVALRSVSLDFYAGQSVALIGPNGSGKTTLLKSVVGLVRNDSGTIRVKGNDTSAGFGYRKHIGYMPQINRFPDHLRVRDLFSMMKRIRQDKTGDYDMELYEQFNIDEMGRKPLGALSGGMSQKVSAALAFYFDPEILILDEPTAGLEPVANDQFKQKVRQSISRKKLVITTSHNLTELDEIANHVSYMMAGEIILSEDLQKLKEQTSEKTLNAMILKLINKQNHHV